MHINNCLVIGANGLVGKYLGKILSRQGIPWTGTYFKRRENGLVKLDITDNNAVFKVIDEYKPDVVFHCSNLAGGVNYCQENPEMATKFHFDATKAIGEICDKNSVRMVFISTDYVFDGKRGPYMEDDQPNPLNLYGELKLHSEGWLLNNLQRATIVRTTNVFGWDPMTVTPNFLMGLYFNLQKKKIATVPSFMWGNPTYVSDLAAALLELVRKALNGIFHVVGPDFIDRYTWAIQAGQLMDKDTSLIKEDKIPPLKLKVPRPLKSNLSTVKFQSACDTVLHTLHDSLQLFKDNMDQIQNA